MCRHLFVTLLFLCRSQDVFMQAPVPCVAGEMTVGQTARITCIFPPGTITAYSSAFVVKKYTDSSDRDIVECKYPQDSNRENPVCLIQDTSLGYAFTFAPENDRQTVVIPSVKLSDAGEYGCDRTGHLIDKCNLNVTARVFCEAGEVTVGQRARITCFFHAGTITPNNAGDFVVKKFSGDSNEEDILVCNHTKGSTSGTPNCVSPNQALGYDFTFLPENDRLTVVIPSVKLSDAGEYGCDRTGHRIDRCNLNVTGDSGKESRQSDENIGFIVGLVVVVVVAAVVVVLYRRNVRKWNKKKLNGTGNRTPENGGDIPLLEEQQRVDAERKYQQAQQDLDRVKQDFEQKQQALLKALQDLDQKQQDLGQAQQELGQAQQDLKEIQTRLELERQACQTAKQLLQDKEKQLEKSNGSCILTVRASL